MANDQRESLINRIRTKMKLTPEELEDLKSTPTSMLKLMLMKHSVDKVVDGSIISGSKDETMDEVKTQEASPEVDGPSEGSPKEKFPSSELSAWDKAQSGIGIDLVKDPEGAVEKTMNELSEDGTKPQSKSARSTPQRIKVNGRIYRKAETVPQRVQFRGAVYELDD